LRQDTEIFFCSVICKKHRRALMTRIGFPAHFPQAGVLRTKKSLPVSPLAGFPILRTLQDGHALHAILPGITASVL
jgi:hypothetical protein